MALSPDLKKLLFFLWIVFPHGSAVTHSLLYRYTALTPGGDLTAVGLLDGEQFVYYDKSTMKIIPKTEWIKKISADDPGAWNTQTERMLRDWRNLNDLFDTVIKDFNHTEGMHTLQREYSCERYDDGNTRGYDQIRYDGEDFISLDLKTGTWTAAHDDAEIIRKKWESTGTRADLQISYLKNECIESVEKFMSYSRETVVRTGGELSGVQIAIVVFAAVGFVAFCVGMIICKKCNCNHVGYVPRPDILEL